MGFREFLSKNGAAVGAVAVLVTCSAVGFAFWQMTPKKPPKPTNQYYFINEGDTQFEQCFADSMEKVPPFDHDGKPAVRAYVYEIDGKKTVLYLKKMNDLAKKDYDKAKPGGMSVSSRMQMDVGRTLVKKPADKDWVPMLSREGVAIMKSNNGVPDLLPTPE